MAQGNKRGYFLRHFVRCSTEVSSLDWNELESRSTEKKNELSRAACFKCCTISNFLHTRTKKTSGKKLISHLLLRSCYKFPPLFTALVPLQKRYFLSINLWLDWSTTNTVMVLFAIESESDCWFDLIRFSNEIVRSPIRQLLWFFYHLPSRCNISNLRYPSVFLLQTKEGVHLRIWEILAKFFGGKACGAT